MTKRTSILIVIGWVLLTLFNYYYVNFFILAFEWLGLVLTLFIMSIIQVIRLIKESNELSKNRIRKALVLTTLFILTFFKSFTNGIIERLDWYILESKREDIVNQVLINELNPNVSWNGWVCELPFEFPVVSNGGNDIGISRNTENGKTTVSFWVFRTFWSA